MKLNVGEVVEFKKYEDMNGGETMGISEEYFPKYGKVKAINVNGCDRFFNIEEEGYTFCTGSVARVISDVDDIDIDSLKPGDEVLMKVTVGEIRENYIWVSWVDKSDVVKVLKRKEPERFIVKEDYYDMYVNGSGVLIADERHAKVFNSRNEANEAAADMHLNAWEVIPYGD